MDPLLAAVGNLGGVVVIEHNGKTYSLPRHLNDIMRANYVAWMMNYRIVQTERRRGLYSPKSFREIMSDLNESFDLGEWTFGSENYFKMLRTDDGATAFLKMIVSDPKITDDELASLLEAKGTDVVRAIRAMHGLPETDEDVAKTVDTPAEGTDPKA